LGSSASLDSPPSEISSLQSVFSCSPAFSPNTDYIVVPVTHSRLLALLKLERRNRQKLRSAFHRDIANSQKRFDALETRLDAKVTLMQVKHCQPIWPKLAREISALEQQMNQCVQRQQRVFTQMTSNREALTRTGSMLRELGNQQANEQQSFYCIHVPCTKDTVQMMSDAHTRVDVRNVRFTAEQN